MAYDEALRRRAEAEPENKPQPDRGFIAVMANAENALDLRSKGIDALHPVIFDF